MADAVESPVLTISLDGWEGPLDLLLALARAQKVDLRDISILALVEQYLSFVGDAGRIDLEVAADYLVMAAWLAYLKSLLLLPRAPDQDPDPDMLAALLQQRLQRLDAMRDAGARLMARDRIGRDVFARGMPEGLRTIGRPVFRTAIFDLIDAYAQVAARTAPVQHQVRRRPVMALDQALARLRAMLPDAAEWRRLESFLPPGAQGDLRRSAVASSFLAALELARQGQAVLRQDAPFAPLMLKAS
ncbi:segregation and condensation protein A [Sphingomonas jejuensis]|uniref:Segregation and condensation protein A n=1 Tax=Sphingomonas jejuensis TaxID=904715 RepID=A0ABX0XH68_9SPHN|nr:ScpA family protein [Sphingomonas jejuensis]NJC32667.1 segregation and condensation protein A [Sphingomonas jejuensis]